jgi:hypothetical protein
MAARRYRLNACKTSGEKPMPLTTSGISIQILASIQAQRTHAASCTTNDCKVVVNHLIRKFSEPLGRVYESQARMSARVAAGNRGNTIRDHAVPVIVLLEELLELPAEHVEISSENVRYVDNFLRQSLLTVEITHDEDLLLSKGGFQRAMPVCWKTVGHEWYLDPLARYKECGIEVQ